MSFFSFFIRLINLFRSYVTFLYKIFISFVVTIATDNLKYVINSSFASLDYDPFRPENLYPEIMVMRPKAFVGSLVKGIAVVGMGNGGEQFRPLLQGLAVKVNGSIFCHHPMQVVTIPAPSSTVGHILL